MEEQFFIELEDYIRRLNKMAFNSKDKELLQLTKDFLNLKLRIKSEKEKKPRGGIVENNRPMVQLDGGFGHIMYNEEEANCRSNRG